MFEGRFDVPDPDIYFLTGRGLFNPPVRLSEKLSSGWPWVARGPILASEIPITFD
jgi:hypothetical protein